jgi:hypothetical protein
MVCRSITFLIVIITAPLFAQKESAKFNSWLWINAKPTLATKTVQGKVAGLHFNIDKQSLSVRLSDILGRARMDLTQVAKSHLQGAETSFEFSVDGLEPGSYLLSAYTSRGVKTTKILVRH